MIETEKDGEEKGQENHGSKLLNDHKGKQACQNERIQRACALTLK